MAIPLFHRNKVVKFWTNYKGKGKYRDYREGRYYLLFSVDESNKLLTFLPITSNRHDYKDYASRYKILNRCSYLESEKYPESFINTDILIIVPFEAIPYLSFCNECPSFCLEEDFEEIIKLHSDLPSYGTEIDEVEITIEYFLKPQSSKNKKV